jgi:hypothetical protein
LRRPGSRWQKSLISLSRNTARDSSDTIDSQDRVSATTWQSPAGPDPGGSPSPGDAAKGNAKVRELLFFDLLAHGIFMMPKRGLIALSLPLTDRDFDTLVSGVEEFIAARKSLLQ